MHYHDTPEHRRWWHGPRLWAVSALAGVCVGALCAFVFPAQQLAQSGAAGTLSAPPVMVAPFLLLLASIALGPLLGARYWHRHYPDVSFFLGALVAAYYLVALRSAGATPLLHAITEYISFIALVGGLYVASAGVQVKFAGPASPLANMLFLFGGAVLANIVGTTGASVLLIRPFLNANAGRVRPMHVVFFIFIVSNCGGCLTPIGDPPLYLGYVKGVPFFWTLQHLWQDWLLVVGALCVIYFVADSVIARPEVRDAFAAEAQSTRQFPSAPARAFLFPRLSVSSSPLSLLLLACIVGAVFLDPLLGKVINLHHVPVGAIVQVVLALAAFKVARADVREANDFTFEPVKEVGLLFAGIFLTMIPALSLLAVKGPSLGIASATSFYFATGGLSAVLDNAPTYLNFLQVAVAPQEVAPGSIHAFLATGGGTLTLIAISTGAVFFGAMTYIGNGPNFMVKAIAESWGVKMPSFFAYVCFACLVLLPVLVVHWLVLIR